MSLEIELKLCLNQPQLPQKLAKLLELNAAYSKKIIGNCYYDTTDRLFFRHKSALRVRTIASDKTTYILSLKQDQSDLIGVSSRLEYEFEQLSPTPDLNLLANIEQVQQNLGLNPNNWYLITDQLEELFSTDFMRQSALIECSKEDKSALELSLDLGSISVSDKSLSIKELEIELKNASIDDLRGFLQILDLDKMDNNFRFSNLSKAHRGSLLFDFNQEDLQNINNFALEIAKINKLQQDSPQDALELQLRISDYFNFYYELADLFAIAISNEAITSACELVKKLEQSKVIVNNELIKQLESVVTATDFYQFWFKPVWFNLCLEQLLAQLKR